MAFAHSANQAGGWQELGEHLRGVADLCRDFATSFGAGELGWYLGLWHDVGKFDPGFQAYLLGTTRRGPDHKAAGCRVAIEKGLGLAAILIQGHHGGLCSPVEMEGWLKAKGSLEGVDKALVEARDLIESSGSPDPSSLPAHLDDPLAADLFLRLLFSALVDADFLDTERHFDPSHEDARGSYAGLNYLWARLEKSQSALPISRGPVGETRRTIYEDCLAAAEGPRGIYRLTAPTGAGKTRSGIAFALRHALIHGQRRVIVALPYTAITEQTADELRKIFDPTGADRVVLEHHSVSDESQAEGENFDRALEWSRLTAENWDAPIIVTTTVQLLESLFGSHTSTSRKVHRIASSVVLLDEAQALPLHLLDPILNASSELARRYKTTMVLSTATQPAFDVLEAFGDTRLTEIVRDPARHFDSLRRVDYQWEIEHRFTWEELAARIRGQHQVLVVVNTKRAALELLAAMEDPDALHLSTLLCAAHRRDVVAEARRRLEDGETCRLVSTQVIEAGVDIDFQVVYREMGPLDGIIQAAGRCNREGKRSKGRVVVFETSEGRIPGGFYKTARDETRVLAARGGLDPASFDAGREYFERLYADVSTDRERIQELRIRLDFPQVAKRFRMIDDVTEDVVVRYGNEEVKEWIEQQVGRLRLQQGSPRLLLRTLRPYIVSLRTSTAEAYRRSGLIDKIIPGVDEWLGDYDRVTGLNPRDLRPDELVI